MWLGLQHISKYLWGIDFRYVINLVMNEKNQFGIFWMKNHLFPFCGNQVRHDGSKREVTHKEIKYSLFLWRSGKVCLVQFREFVLRKLVLGNYHLSHVCLLFLKSWSLSLTHTLFSLFLFSVCVCEFFCRFFNGSSFFNDKN